MSQIIVDDKSPICIPFILERVRAHQERQQQAQTSHGGSADGAPAPPPPPPFIIGLNGVQGVGKTTLVRALASALRDAEGLPTLVVSIDDFYLTHADQVALARANPDNALVQCRGEPGRLFSPRLSAFIWSWFLSGLIAASQAACVAGMIII